MQTIQQVEDGARHVGDFFTRRGHFGIVTLVDFLITPYGRNLMTLCVHERFEIHALEAEFLSSERVEGLWRAGKVVIGSGQQCMPLPWLERCVCFWDELSPEAQEGFAKACSMLTLHYREQARRAMCISWKSFEETLPV